MTTPRAKLLNVFRHERPDGIPIAGHCDPYKQPNRAGMDPALAAALGAWMYVHRDSFRTPLWETRPWSAARRFADAEGKMRTTPWNGLDGKAKDYDTGTEITYDHTP